MPNTPAGASAPPIRSRGRLGSLADSVLLIALSIGVLLIALLALASSASARPAAGAPSTIRIGYQLIPNGDAIVRSQHWLEQAFPKTKIKWIEFDSGASVNQAVVAGAIDIGLAGSSPVTAGLAPPLNIGYRVPWIFDVIGTNEALVVKPGITSLRGLAGKKIATPFASTSHYSLLAALAQAGVDPASVDIIDLQPQDILAAWQRGDIDGAYVWTPTLAELRKTGKTLITSAALAKSGKATADLAVVRTAFAKQYPDAVKTWVAQEDRAVKLYRSNPSKAAAAIGKALNLSTSEARAQAKELVWLDAKQQASAAYLGRPGKPGALAVNLESAAEFLRAQDKIPAVPGIGVFQRGLANNYVTVVAGG